MTAGIQRTRYVVDDDYVDPEYTDESINVGCVCSPRFSQSNRGIEVRELISTMGGFAIRGISPPQSVTP
jgi:hypothetical protein